MSILKLFEGPAMDKYSSAYLKSLNAPTTFDYNIASNKAAGQFIQDRTKELLGDNLASDILGQAATYASVPLAFMSSPFYEGFQVARDKMEPGSGIKGFFDAYAQERPFATPVERAAGVLQSTPVGEALYNLGGKIADLNFGFTSAAAAEPTSSQKFSQQFSVTQPSQFSFKPEPMIPGNVMAGSLLQDVVDTPTVVDEYEKDLEEIGKDADFAFLMPGKDRTEARLGELIDFGLRGISRVQDMPLDLEELAALDDDIIEQQLAAASRGEGETFFDKIKEIGSSLGIVGALGKLDNFKNLSPLDQKFILEQAGGNVPNQDAFGYNIRSAFGNYANLVSNKALKAKTKAQFGIPLTAMDLYYQKKEEERAAEDRAVLDAAFDAGQGGSGQDFTGGRYDGADTFAEYSAEPTAYSGSS